MKTPLFLLIIFIIMCLEILHLNYNRSTSLLNACSDLKGDDIVNNKGIKRYNRKDWRHWIDEKILDIDIPITINSLQDCRVIKGSWIGRLTGTLLSDASDKI